MHLVKFPLLAVQACLAAVDVPGGLRAGDVFESLKQPQPLIEAQGGGCGCRVDLPLLADPLHLAV